MAVDSVEVIEPLDLLCNLCWRISWCVVARRLLSVDTPVVDQPLEHGEGAKLVQLAETTEYGQLLICHALKLESAPNITILLVTLAHLRARERPIPYLKHCKQLAS